MARDRKLEVALAALRSVRDDPRSNAATTELRNALEHRSSHVVASAAGLIAELDIRGLARELEAAFDRFMRDPAKTDKGCRAKAALSDALYRTEEAAHALYLRGIRHVQLEPVYGGKADTAARLRGVCALGLVRINYPDVLAELAELLADPEPAARRSAARAIGYHESERGLPLLRLKLLSGDEDPEVIAECLAALLKIGSDSSLAFVGRLLERADRETCQAAALALGESRVPDALALLRDLWERNDDAELRRTALLAIATLRHDQALEFLLALIAEGIGPSARDAIEALAIYKDDVALCERVRNTAERREDLDLSGALEKAF